MYKVVSYYREDQQAISTFENTTRYQMSEYNFYLRNLILSILNSTADSTALINKLSTLQLGIAKLLTPFYSETVSLELANLLKSNVSIISDYVIASKAKQDLTSIQTKWVENTDEFATLLSSVDPVRWTKTAIVTVCTQNANYIHRQISSRLSNDWESEIDAMDLLYKNFINFADMISNGIIISNLEKFSKQ